MIVQELIEIEFKQSKFITYLSIEKTTPINKILYMSISTPLTALVSVFFDELYKIKNLDIYQACTEGPREVKRIIERLLRDYRQKLLDDLLNEPPPEDISPIEVIQASRNTIYRWHNYLLYDRERKTLAYAEMLEDDPQVVLQSKNKKLRELIYRGPLYSPSFEVFPPLDTYEDLPDYGPYGKFLKADRPNKSFINLFCPPEHIYEINCNNYKAKPIMPYYLTIPLRNVTGYWDEDFNLDSFKEGCTGPREACGQILTWLKNAIPYNLEHKSKRNQKAIYITGVERTGKTTIANIFTSLIGQSNMASDTTHGSLTKERFSAPLRNKLGYIIDEATLKIKDQKVIKYLLNKTGSLESKGQDIGGVEDFYLNIMIISNKMAFTMITDDNKKALVINTKKGDAKDLNLGVTIERLHKENKLDIEPSDYWRYLENVPWQDLANLSQFLAEMLPTFDDSGLIMTKRYYEIVESHYSPVQKYIFNYLVKMQKPFFYRDIATAYLAENGISNKRDDFISINTFSEFVTTTFYRDMHESWATKLDARKGFVSNLYGKELSATDLLET